MKNEIKYNWLWLVLVFLGVLHATPIAIDVAENNALQWMKSKNHQNYTIKKQLFANGTTKSRTKKNPSKYRILELEPKGWVIVSLDDVIKPIIGYGDSKIDSNLPPALVEYLDGIEKTIDYLSSHPKALKKKRDEKMLYGANDYGYVVRPLLWMGSSSDTEEQGIRWDQGEYYNAYTPIDANGNHTWTGCVATAMGQLMRYWKYPSVGKGQHCYTPQTHPEYGEQCVDFGVTTYDWANMPLTLTSNNDTVAQALYHAGVAVDMDYTPDESEAWLGDKLKKYFNYKLSAELDSHFFTGTGAGTEWDAMLKKELDETRPVVYAGFNPNGGGHIFIIDGYDTDGYYHFNWGWGGSVNGKFTLATIDYSDSQYMYIIAPTDPSPQVTISDSHFTSCIVDQLSLENSSEIKEWSLKYTGTLDCKENNISSVEELSYFKYVHYLDLSKNNLQGTLNVSNMITLSILDISDNNISTVLLPNSHYWRINLDSNPNLNILEIEDLKNIQSLYAYGTQNIACWQKNTLAIENNITNIYMGCSSSQGDNLDTDGDGMSNVDDPDDDNDGINDLEDDDIDGDSVVNSEDRFPLDANESLDTDNDGIGNNADTDDDNDGVLDGEDVFPLDANESLDTDNDGIGNNADTDDDNDGVLDGEDRFPLDANESLDTDNDGIGNNADTDDDNDGVLDGEDVFPLDANESLDTDNDGIGNNADTDDDNDGISDTDELKYGLNPLDASDGGNADADGDGVSNADEIEAGSNPLDARDTKKPKRFVPIIMDDMVVLVPLVD